MRISLHLLGKDGQSTSRGKRRHYDRPVNWYCTARDSAKCHNLLDNLLGSTAEELALVPAKIEGLFYFCVFTSISYFESLL